MMYKNDVGYKLTKISKSILLTHLLTNITHILNENSNYEYAYPGVVKRNNIVFLLINFFKFHPFQLKDKPLTGLPFQKRLGHIFGIIFPTINHWFDYRFPFPHRINKSKRYKKIQRDVDYTFTKISKTILLIHIHQILHMY